MRMLHIFGIRDTFLVWITAFLHECILRVSVNNVTSDDNDVVSGMIQGSVLGSQLFLLFTSSIVVCIYNAFYLL